LHLCLEVGIFFSMPKADFDFYSLGNDLPEFVVPAPESDPYNGFLVPERTMLAVNGVREAIGTHSPYVAVVHVTEGATDSRFDFLFKTVTEEGQLVHKTHTRAVIKPPAEKFENEEALQAEINEWFTSLSGALKQPVPVIDDEANDFDRAPEIARIVAELTPKKSVVEEYPYITDHQGKPHSPDINYATALNLRAYRWLPGPMRIGADGKKLDPVYNPQRSPILLASTVNITLLNPKVTETS
jgi:hypothetical protein